MAITRMKLVNIVGRMRDFDDIVRHCCLNGNFHPEQAPSALENYEEFMPVEEPNPYSRSLRTAVDISVHSGLKLGYRDFTKLGLSEKELFLYTQKVEKEINALNEKLRTHEKNAARLQQGITQLNNLRGAGLNLDDMFKSRFINYNFGKLPKSSYPKLDVYDDDQMVIFFPINEDTEYYWGFYVTLKHDYDKIDDIFNSLYFERITIIEEAHGTPEEAIKSVTSLLKKVTGEISDVKKEIENFWKTNLDRFLQVYSELKYLNDSFEIRKYAAKCGDSFYIFGWVPAEELPRFKKCFDKMQNVDCVIEDETAAGDITPPTSLRNNPVVRPFESFVAMYGLPNYHEIDPTSFMAMTYSMIFGIMFGDLGQGFVLLLLSLFLWYKKKMPLGGMMIRCSIFSMIFGTLYDSVFGYENLLPVDILHVHDSGNTNYILLFAVGLGILLIITTMFLNMINGIKQKDPEKLLFSQNGISGLIFYVYCITVAITLVMFKVNLLSPVYIILFAVLPLLLIGFREPLGKIVAKRKDWKPESIGEFLIQVFFELFEILLSYLSNTISFIRIGAFVLSHAGMMAAVFALSALCGKGYLAMVIFGNIFVLCLEGLIVGIQGIRLQFYEIFSRFYVGDGKPYQPAKIKYDG